MPSQSFLQRFALHRLAEPTAPVAYVLLVVTMLCWAGNFVIGRWASAFVPPLTLAALRWTGASLLILPLAAAHLRRDWPLVRANPKMLIFLGVMGSGVFNTLQYIALGYTTATSAAIINSSGPVMIAVASWLLLALRIHGFQALGIAISLAGVATVLARGEFAGLAGIGKNPGDLMMVVAVIGWAVYTTLLYRRPAIHPFSFAAITYVVAAVLNLPLSLIEIASGAHANWTPASVAAVAYTAIFPSFIAYLCFARGVEIIGGTRAGAFMHLIPLFAGILSMIFLGEAPHLYHAGGFALILAGVYLAARGM